MYLLFFICIDVCMYVRVCTHTYIKEPTLIIQSDENTVMLAS